MLREYEARARIEGAKKEVTILMFGRVGGLEEGIKRGEVVFPCGIIDGIDLERNHPFVYPIHNVLVREGDTTGWNLNVATTLEETVEQLLLAKELGCSCVEMETRETVEAINRARRRYEGKLNIHFGFVGHVSDVPLRGATLGELERAVLSQQPIRIPQNPFYEVLTRFGRDEALAMLVNVVGTAGLAWAMEQGMGASLSKNDRDVVLAATGPVIEKVGFFPAHLKEAWEVYKTTPQDEREAFSYYVKKGLKEGSKSLLEDVLIHDPMYGLLMYKGLQMYPQTPAWMMATLSFVAAVFAVAGLEVGYNELQYVREKHKWKKAGFGEESYYEARFLMSSEQKKENFLFQMERDFSLSETMVGKYHDVYIPHTLPTYSGRNARLRLRQRVLEAEGRDVKTAQIVYTRAAEMATKTQEQFRYFLSRKDKLYLKLEGEMPSTIEELADVDVRAKSIETALA